MTPHESSMPGATRTILCIDDEPSMLRFYQHLLEDEGYEVVSFTDGSAGLAFFASAQVDLAVLDYSMPGLDGMEVARTMRGINPVLPIIMVSGRPECPPAAKSWINVYLVKVQDFDKLVRHIESFWR
jgi:CheY-like chemotaxis protein